MRKSTTELKVGIFAIIVILVLSYMTFKVGSLPLLWEKGYRLYVEFDDISGLDEKSRIRIAGVESGIVDRITLEEGKAKITLLLNPDVKVHKDAIAYLGMTGLLGDKYIALDTGTPDSPLLESGDRIVRSMPAANIDRLANQLTHAAAYITALTKDISSILGDTEKKAIKESISNLKIFSSNLKEISTENRVPINTIIARLDEFTAILSRRGPEVLDNFDRMAKDISDKGPGLVDDLSTAARELKEVLVENRQALKEGVESFAEASESVSNIAMSVESGEGTVGKLVQDKQLYDSITKVSDELGKSLDVVGRLRTFMEFGTEYNTEDAEWKGRFNLTLMPERDKYYILGVVSDPVGSVETTDTTINGVTTREEEVKTRIEFTAQFAKRFEDFALRIGMMESTFGFGADYFFNDDKGRLKIDMWDFDNDEVDADESHLKIGIDYRVFKYLFVSGGIDNLLNSNRRGIYVGGGLKFEDEDFKYLFGQSPDISLP
jgi:phospholipid/cholesterol/gamma-HCH transport system substrate-binding protein